MRNEISLSLEPTEKGGLWRNIRAFILFNRRNVAILPISQSEIVATYSSIMQTKPKALEMYWHPLPGRPDLWQKGERARHSQIFKEGCGGTVPSAEWTWRSVRTAPHSTQTPNNASLTSWKAYLNLVLSAPCLEFHWWTVCVPCMNTLYCDTWKRNLSAPAMPLRSRSRSHSHKHTRAQWRDCDSQWINTLTFTCVALRSSAKTVLWYHYRQSVQSHWSLRSFSPKFGGLNLPRESQINCSRGRTVIKCFVHAAMPD